MNEQAHLSVDLADPQDIRDKLPNIRALYAQKQRDLADLQKEVESWRGFLGHLAAIAGEGMSEETRDSIEILEGASRTMRARNKAPAQDAAVEALRAVGRPMGPTALYRFMVGNGEKHATNANAVGAALWGALKAGRISKTSDGLYAPPGWKPLDKGELLALPETSGNGGSTNTS